MEGIFAAPEGAAALAGYRKLREQGFFAEKDTVVLFNTGSGLKYLDVVDSYGKKRTSKMPASRAIGGIIGPY
jgi:threonine synthase